VSTLNNFLTVVSFTIRNKFRTKAFLITTIIIAIILSIGVNLPYIINQFQSDKAANIGYVETAFPEVTSPLKAYYDNLDKQDLKLVSYPDAGSPEANEKALKQAIADGKIKGYLEFKANKEINFPDLTYKSEDVMDMGKSGSLSAALQSIKMESVLKDANLTEQQKKTLFAPVEIGTVQISATGGAGSIGDGKTESERGVAMGLVYVLIVLLFMGVMITGQLIATEITAEKSSRVMEVLITSVSPLKQMFGKIVGMLFVGLSQIAIYVIVFLINVSLPHNVDQFKQMDINLGDVEPLMLVYAILFYLLGYFLFATLFAAVGSIVSRTEDLGQAVMPITLLSMAGFYIGIFGMTQPNTLFIKVCSFIPFFSPYIMFLRIGLSDPAVWEVALSLAILIASILLFGWLSAKIYRTGVLMYGKRPSFKELRKAMKAYKF
jgi:ABC-2 type transport system permease protein